MRLCIHVCLNDCSKTKIKNPCTSDDCLAAAIPIIDHQLAPAIENQILASSSALYVLLISCYRSILRSILYHFQDSCLGITLQFAEKHEYTACLKPFHAPTASLLYQNWHMTSFHRRKESCTTWSSLSARTTCLSPSSPLAKSVPSMAPSYIRAGRTGGSRVNDWT